MDTFIEIMNICTPLINIAVSVLFLIIIKGVIRDHKKIKESIRDQEKIKQAIRFLSQNINPLSANLLSEMMEHGPLTKEQIAANVERQQLYARQEFAGYIDKIKKGASPEELAKIKLLEADINGIFDIAQTLGPDSSDEYRNQVMQNLQHSLEQLRQKLEE
ncbi:MAG: hypothetical protein GF334_11010 [Candidatus Altiarchaeales archaeon]|nr:hypothetical protein [Candidatus Altiarchaeales archaeon]